MTDPEPWTPDDLKAMDDMPMLKDDYYVGRWKATVRAAWEERDAARLVPDNPAAVARHHAWGRGILEEDGPCPCTVCAIAKLTAELDEYADRWYKPCLCDPPGSGEEFCRGDCYLAEARATISTLTEELAETQRHSREHHLEFCESCAATESELISMMTAAIKVIDTFPTDPDWAMPYKLSAAIARLAVVTFRIQTQPPLPPTAAV